MKMITRSRHAFRLLQHLGQFEVEEFWLMALHPNKRVIGIESIFRGTVDACPVFPRDVFRAAIRLNSSSILVAHNHPSGDPAPSPMDKMVTSQLILGGELLGIPIDDHLIIAGRKYFSFLDSGELSVIRKERHHERYWAGALPLSPLAGR